MRLCHKHTDRLTGDGDCLLCHIEDMERIIFQQKIDINLNNALLSEKNAEIKRLKAQIEQDN